MGEKTKRGQVEQGAKKNQLQMKILIWNIRGIGKPARVRQLKEMILQEQVEVVGIQETIK
jgi:hypothetical protein